MKRQLPVNRTVTSAPEIPQIQSGIDLFMNQMSELAKIGITPMNLAEFGKPIGYFTTGSILLDLCVGVHPDGIGVPSPSIVELYGPPSTGKTTIAVLMTLYAIRNGGVVGYWDAEGRLWEDYARELGSDTSKILYNKSTSMITEIAAQIEFLSKSLRRQDTTVPFLAVVDSLGSVTYPALLEEESPTAKKSELDQITEKYNRVHYMSDAKVQKQCMKLLWEAVRGTNCVLLLLNHVHSYQTGKVTPGGVFTKFMSSLRISISESKPILRITDGKQERIGHSIECRIEKNSTSMPFQKCIVDLEYGVGIRRSVDLLRAAVRSGLVQMTGGTYSYNGEALGKAELQTAEKLLERFESEQSLIDAITQTAISGGVNSGEETSNESE